MKKIYTTIICITLVTAVGIAHAQPRMANPGAGGYSGPAQQMPDPREFVRGAIKRIKAFLSTDDSVHPDKINAFIEKEVAPLFDFPAMTHVILGELNYQLTDKQRQGATTMVKRAFLSAVANNLADYRGGQVGNLRVSGRPEMGRLRVGMAIYLPNEYPTAIELRIALGPKGWKILDVAANGVSAVAHYRNYVRSVVQRSGLEGLMQ